MYRDVEGLESAPSNSCANIISWQSCFEASMQTVQLKILSHYYWTCVSFHCDHTEPACNSKQALKKTARPQVGKSGPEANAAAVVQAGAPCSLRREDSATV